MIEKLTIELPAWREDNSPSKFVINEMYAKINQLIDAANKHEVQQNIMQYKCRLSRHKAIMDALEDFEQLMAAPYDAEHLVNYISYTRNYHVSCYKQINNRLKEMEK